MEKQMLKKLSLGAGFLAGCIAIGANKTNKTANNAKMGDIPVAQEVKKLDACGMKNIYVVDMPKVYDNYYKTKSAQENFQMLAKQAQSEYDKMMQEAKKVFDERDELIKKLNNPANSEAKKKDLEKQITTLEERINKKGEELSHFRQEKDEMLDQKRQAVLSEHFKEINAGIEGLAKQKNADFVLNKAAVLYSKPEFDITTEVIQVVNKPAEKNNEAAKSAKK